MKTTNSYSKVDPYKLAELELQILDRIEELLEVFEIDYTRNYNRIMCQCPIHQGDNPTALNLYLDGHTRPGHWVCNTRQCQDVFKPTLTGFIRGVLSARKGWEKPGDTIETFKNTVDFMVSFCGRELSSFNVSSSDAEKRKFHSKISGIRKDASCNKMSIPRQKVLSSLAIPSQYYSMRGFSHEVLQKYDVGECKNPDSFMRGRVVVPIYDSKHNNMIACSGRTLKEGQKPKWIHTSGFDADSCLYNSWFAKDFIKESNIAILVEGPADVWRLEENGIHNSVAMFGTTLSDGQKDILDMMGAMSLVIMTDNDDAGRKGAINTLNKCKRTYRVYIPNFTGSDVGDITLDSITSDINPLIEKIKRTQF